MVGNSEAANLYTSLPRLLRMLAACCKTYLGLKSKLASFGGATPKTIVASRSAGMISVDSSSSNQQKAHKTTCTIQLAPLSATTRLGRLASLDMSVTWVQVCMHNKVAMLLRMACPR